MWNNKRYKFALHASAAKSGEEMNHISISCLLGRLSDTEISLLEVILEGVTNITTSKRNILLIYNEMREQVIRRMSWKAKAVYRKTVCTRTLYHASQ
jgi:hypothetical protein